SYGPGRYDSNYEEGGQDYPVGFVRWTEQRNFEAALDLMASGVLDVSALVSHRFRIDEAPKAYELLMSNEPSLGILIQYPRAELDSDARIASRVVQLASGPSAMATGGSPKEVAISVIGAGNY